MKKTYSETKAEEAHARNPDAGVLAEEYVNEYSSHPGALPGEGKKTGSTAAGQAFEISKTETSELKP